MTPPNRENDVQGRRHHPTGKNAGKGFRPKHPNPMLHVHGATFGHHSHGSPSGATPRLHAPYRRSSTIASSVRTTSAAGPPPRPALGAASTPPGQAAARHHHGTAGEATRKPPRPQHHATAGIHAVAPHAVAMQTPRRAAVAPHSQLADRSRAATGRCRTFSQLRSRPHAQMRPRSLGRCHLQCRPRTRNHRISLARLNFLTQDHAKK